MGAVERSLAAHANTLRRGANRVPCARPFAEERRLRRQARVVPVAPLDIRRDRLQDLQRIFDGPVDVIETSSTDRAGAHAGAFSIAADAIVIDVVSPLQLADLIGGLVPARTPLAEVVTSPTTWSSPAFPERCGPSSRGG
jgi:hypothetical protein